jgi:hypothetical protein
VNNENKYGHNFQGLYCRYSVKYWKTNVYLFSYVDVINLMNQKKKKEPCFKYIKNLKGFLCMSTYISSFLSVFCVKIGFMIVV